MVLALIFEHKPWGNHPWSSDTEGKGGLGEQAFPYTINPLYNHTFDVHFFFRDANELWFKHVFHTNPYKIVTIAKNPCKISFYAKIKVQIV